MFQVICIDKIIIITEISKHILMSNNVEYFFKKKLALIQKYHQYNLKKQ